MTLGMAGTRRRALPLLLVPLLLLVGLATASFAVATAQPTSGAQQQQTLELPHSVCNMGFDHSAAAAAGAEALHATSFAAVQSAAAAAATPHAQPRAVPPLHPLHPRLEALPVRTLEDILADARQRHRAQLARELAAVTAASPSPPVLVDGRVLSALDALELSKPLPAVPPSYDPRSNPTMNGSLCESVSSIRDQGNCGADWAAAVAAAMSDRTCIRSGGAHQPFISIQDILSCCGWACGMGCSGGYTFDAWSYLSSSGAVSGGEFNSSGAAGGCLPYSLPPCVHNLNGTEIPCDSTAGVTRTPVCVRQCQDGESWSSAKYCTAPPYRLPAGNVSAIQAELFYSGPVSATMLLYQDFAGLLPNAVYQHAKGRQIGALAVKIIGFGTDFTQIDYWLVANSWGAGWGGSGGFFKILRGTNECQIESGVVAAQPADCQPVQ